MTNMTKTTNLLVGAPNPRALTEIVLRRRIDWNRVANPEAIVEAALGVKYNELFDPKFKTSPLYIGLREQPEPPRAPEAQKAPDHEQDALTRAKSRSPAQHAQTIQARRASLAYLLRKPVPGDSNTPWHPAGTTWLDPGMFFDEGTERINMMTWSHAYQWARSSETGEIWPAVYEKAVAKWRGHNNTDHPDMTALNYGDCVDASLNLTGLSRTYYDNSNMTGDQIWQTVRGSSLSYRTFNPMTCWTHGTAPPGLDYAAAGVVANHCYTILGWHYVSGTEYIVLRNPWGYHEATLDVLGTGPWQAYDKSFWRPVALNTGGVFAIKADTFKRYW